MAPLPKKGILSVLILLEACNAFSPSQVSRLKSDSALNPMVLSFSSPAIIGGIGVHHHRHHHPRNLSTVLQMAADDFSEAAYTEGAWACIASLTNVAEFLSSTTIGKHRLLDVTFKLQHENEFSSHFVFV